MRAPFGNSQIVTKEMQGHFRPGHDKIVSRKFGLIAKALWPEKTAWHVAAICKCDERHAKRFIDGEYPVPYAMERAVLDAMHGVD